MCGVCVAVAGVLVATSQVTPIELLSEYSNSNKTLSSFSGSSTKLSTRHKSELGQLVKSSPNLISASCTGLTARGASRAAVNSALARARASCNYIKGLAPGVTLKTGTKQTTVRSSVGKVSISIRFPRSGNASGLTPGATVPAEPKSIADIKSYDQIVYWAWKKSADKINASSSVVKNIDILIGPNSGILNKNPLAATEVTSKLFAGFAQPTNISFVSFSFEDSSWAQSKLEELLADPELMQMIKSPNRGGERGQTVAICPDAERCHSSSPFTNRRKQSVVLAGYAANRLNNVGETQGELQAHEYTHVVQQHQFLGTAREMQGLASLREHLPWWLAEGGADFGGFAAKYYDNFSGYSTARMRDVYRVPKQTPEWFANFINPPSIDYWIQLGNNGDIYNIGFMVVEIFTAVKGPDAQMEITRLLANGKTMDEAFETVFSMPWRTAVPLIAELISRERGRF